MTATDPRPALAAMLAARFALRVSGAPVNASGREVDGPGVMPGWIMEHASHAYRT